MEEKSEGTEGEEEEREGKIWEIDSARNLQIFQSSMPKYALGF